MVTINYGGGDGSDILQAAQSLAQQNMQRYALNQQLAQNLSSSFIGGVEMGQKGADKHAANLVLQQSNAAKASQQDADNKFKQQQLAVAQAKLTPEQRKAAGLPVLGGLPDYSQGAGPPEIEPPSVTSQIIGQNGAPAQPGAGSAGPAGPVSGSFATSLGGLPGQYISPNESINSPAGGGTALQSSQPADIHQHTGQVIENTASDVESHVNASNLRPEGKVVWNKLIGERRAIQKDNLTTPQRNQAMAQWLAKFRGTMGGTNFKNFTVPVETPEEFFAKNSIQQPDGSTIFFSKAKDGTPTPHHIPGSGLLVDKEKHFDDNTVLRDGERFTHTKDGWKKISDVREDEDNFHAEPPSKYIAKHYSTLKKDAYSQLEKEATKKTKEGEIPEPPSTEEVHARILEDVKNMYALFHGMKHGEEMTAEAGRQKASIDAKTMEAVHALKQMGILQPPVQQASFPPNVSQPAATPEAQPEQPIQQPVATAQTPVTGSPITPRTPTPPALAQAAVNSLPKVNSKAEYDELKKKAKEDGKKILFLDSDGNVRSTP